MMPFARLLLLSALFLSSDSFQLPAITKVNKLTVRLYDGNNYDDKNNINSLIADDVESETFRQQGNRFWVKSIPYIIDSQNILSNQSPLDSGNSIKSSLAESGVDVAQVEVGIVLLPSIDGLTKIIPIHNGMLQNQHTSYQDLSADSLTKSVNDTSSAIVCGFFPRASHKNIDEDNERPMDLDRFHALNHALLATYSISHTDLLDTQFTGTPPSRIYRSFVSPRTKPNYLLESVQKSALRVAAQIEIAIRQVRADEAEYLRNTDKEAVSERDIQPVAFLLDNLRSAFNVGSIFRTAETGGVKEIITAGITPHPPNQKLRKTAFTSMDVVPSTHFEDIMKAVEYLKTNGYKIAVMETTEDSEMYTDVEYPYNTVLVVGNELTGVDTRVINLADYVIQIPTYGIKNSLNVASAAPIVLYEVLRQWRDKKKKEKV